MKTLFHFFTIIILSISLVQTDILSVHGQCLHDQRSFLLQFKNDLEINITDDYSMNKLETWNAASDDCSLWEGVTCNTNGHVIALDLSYEWYLSGVINDSSPLFNLLHLQHLNLAHTDFKGQDLPTNFVNLKYLNLAGCNFAGQIPKEISSLTSLDFLDLSDNYYQNQTLELLDLKKLVQNLSRITELYLDGVHISTSNGINDWSRALSTSLPNLRVLSLARCNLSGPMDSSLQNLRFLYDLDLSGNNLASPIPDFLTNFSNLSRLILVGSGLRGNLPERIFHMPNLKLLALSHNNQLNGSLPEFPRNGSLEQLYLANCTFSGMIPSSISNLKELRVLDLSRNNFSGQIPSLSDLKELKWLFLNGNKLNGSISSTNWEELDLTYLHLDDNSFSGKLPWSLFNNSQLVEASISHNQFTGSLNEFPKVSRSNLKALDLSSNRIYGGLPSWIWDIESLTWLDVSHNFLVEVGKPLNVNFQILKVLDLHANQIQGHITFLSAHYVDYSSNNFSSIMLSTPPFTHNLLLSNNNLEGSIPDTVCSEFLTVLDLSNNFYSGTIPKCLFQNSSSLTSLKLSSNRLGGSLSSKFARNCSLEYLDLFGNLFEGKIPRSIANCKMLKFLNLGKNQFNDIFPFHLMKISTLQVLELQSNKLHGSVQCPEKKGSWSNLHIINIASNDFGGELPEDCLKTWDAMMVHKSEDEALSFSFESFYNYGLYGGLSTHFYETFVTTKGQERNLPKIFIYYTLLDFSCNNFQGNIPEVIGKLKELRTLNLSHNALDGCIPSSMGGMTNLESLDLSRNNLSGLIPSELARLTYLGYGDFSYNQLVGQIPTSTQLQSFPNSSFQGNPGLCGPPLSKNCSKHDLVTKEPDDQSNSKSGIDWSFISIEVGFTFGLGLVVLPIAFSRRWRIWYYGRVEPILFKLFPRLDPTNYKSRKMQVGNLQNLRRRR